MNAPGLPADDRRRETGIHGPALPLLRVTARNPEAVVEALHGVRAAVRLTRLYEIESHGGLRASTTR